MLAPPEEGDRRCASRSTAGWPGGVSVLDSRLNALAPDTARWLPNLDEPPSAAPSDPREVASPSSSKPSLAAAPTRPSSRGAENVTDLLATEEDLSTAPNGAARKRWGSSVPPSTASLGASPGSCAALRLRAESSPARCKLARSAGPVDPAVLGLRGRAPAPLAAAALAPAPPPWWSWSAGPCARETAFAAWEPDPMTEIGAQSPSASSNGVFRLSSGVGTVRLGSHCRGPSAPTAGTCGEPLSVSPVERALYGS